MSDIKKLLQGMLENGWDGLDESKLAALEQALANSDQEETRRQAAIVHAALGDADGARFVDWLIEKTLRRPPGNAERTAVGAEAYAIAKARREGQNQIVFLILSALAIAKGDVSETSMELDA